MANELNEINRALGRIEGKIDALEDLPKRIDKIDERLRNVEVKAAKNGAIAGVVTGGIVAVGIELVKAKIGSLFGGN
jgi:hypothetical protein